MPSFRTLLLHLSKTLLIFNSNLIQYLDVMSFKSSLLTITVPLLACVASALIASPSYDQVLEVTPEFACYNYADPDHGIGDYCRCYNGATTTNAPQTGTNTGTNYNPCPYTVAPPAPTLLVARIALEAASTSTSTFPGNASSTAATSQLPCYNFADPDNGVGDYCMCSNNGSYISTPIAQATGTNTGSDYNPCPYTVAPTVQLATVSVPGPPAGVTASSTATCTDDEPVAMTTTPTTFSTSAICTE